MSTSKLTLPIHAQQMKPSLVTHIVFNSVGPSKFTWMSLDITDIMLSEVRFLLNVFPWPHAAI